jgi:hypothetical protein
MCENSVNPAANEQPQTGRKYSDKWQERFDFFEIYEKLGRAEKKALLKAMPFKKRLHVSINWTSYFFGAIHMSILGMWKRNLALLGLSAIAFVVWVIIAITFQLQSLRIWNFLIIVGIWYGFTTNYAYYLKEIKGYNGWNPFKKIP